MPRIIQVTFERSKDPAGYVSLPANMTRKQAQKTIKSAIEKLDADVEYFRLSHAEFMVAFWDRLQSDHSIKRIQLDKVFI